MRYRTYLLLLMLFSAGLTACSPVSLHPVKDVGGDRFPARFQGEFVVDRILGGAPGETMQVSLIAGEGDTVRIVYLGEGNRRSEETGVYDSLADGGILSVSRTGQEWAIFLLEEAEEGHVRVKELSLERVRNDIRLGTVSGRLEQFDAPGDLAVLTATSSELHAYISKNRDVFSKEALAILRRIQ